MFLVQSGKRGSIPLIRVLVVLVLSTFALAGESLIFDFNAAQDGANPYSKLVFDTAGNLYGTTQNGGTSLHGGVFELTPLGGVWALSKLYNFTGGTDGGTPYAGVTLDAAGNVYGTTFSGGIYNGGVVFELTPNQSGGWNESVLYSFKGGLDGSEPIGGLVFDKKGRLYGTTWAGGQTGNGTVFQLTPHQGGGWTETILHTFSGAPDGGGPLVSLIFDKNNNLYSTTWRGGTLDMGCVFTLTPSQSGGWTESVLYSFKGGNDGTSPYSELVMDTHGNLYGTTSGGSQTCGGCGTFFELSRARGWKESVIHKFAGGSSDGSYPYGGLTVDTSGNIYGSTTQGGASGFGTVFSWMPATKSFVIAYSFFGGSSDGANPNGGLVLDTAGNLYGTTYFGGAYGQGTAFIIR